jgi:hypothetical protein
VKITLKHMRQVKGFSSSGVGFCRRGMRLWFDEYGLDYNDFRKNGIDEEILTATKDPMALAAVEQAHGR